MRGHLGEQFSGLHSGVRQRNALSGGGTKSRVPLLHLSLMGGEVLNDLLLVDANLGEPLEDFIHFEGGALDCDRKPEITNKKIKGKVKEIACQ